MRLYPIIFLAVLIASQSEAVKFRDNLFKVLEDVETRSAIDDKLKKMLESLKEIMKNGNESLGVPVLDPFESAGITLPPINWEDLQGEMSFGGISISGLSNYNVKDATLSVVGLKLNLLLEWPKISGDLKDYEISNSRMMNFVNVFGNGDAEFSIENVKFSLNVSIAQNSETKFLFLKTVETKVSIADNGDNGHVKIYTEGLYNDKYISQVFSTVISEVTPEAFATYYNDIITALNKFINDTGNKFLDGMTMKDLLALVNGKKKFLL